jgi:hypothetical protein
MMAIIMWQLFFVKLGVAFISSVLFELFMLLPFKSCVALLFAEQCA